MECKNKKTALITGACGGLGGSFVEVLAERGYALFLVGRSEEKLQKKAQEIQEKFPQTTIDIFVLDLTNEGGRYAMNEEIRAKNLKISLLVNAAGVDIQKTFSSYSQEKISMQCRVNFEAAVSLCAYAIENRAEELEIINVSSVSGIYPMPYFAIYSATKGALTSFSASLREEMKGKGVRVTAVLPGAMPTRLDIQEQIKGQGLWGKLAAKDPKWVAERALKAVSKNKRILIPGFWNKAMRVSTAWLPTSWRLRFIAKRWSKISKDAF